MSPFDRLFSAMTQPLNIMVYFGFIALLFFDFDQPIAHYFYVLDLRHKIPVLSYLTRLGLGMLYVPTFLLLALLFRYVLTNAQWEARMWFLLLCVMIPGTICWILKIILGRARPSLYIDNQLYGFYGLKWNAHFWSLPSGHTTTIMGVILGLSVLFPRYFYGFILLGTAVALSRVFLSHHYLSDVLLAAYLAIIEVGTLLYILRRKFWLVPGWEDRLNKIKK